MVKPPDAWNKEYFATDWEKNNFLRRTLLDEVLIRYSISRHEKVSILYI